MKNGYWTCVYVKLVGTSQSVPHSLENQTLKNSRNYKMERLFHIFLLLWMGTRVNGQETMDIFIKDLVATFQLNSPTIIYDKDDEIPEICYDSHWVLCLSSTNPIQLANRESENEGMLV